MPHYAYIDESGTMDHQDVMTVAAVVFEGANSSAKLHDHVMRDLIPNYSEVLRQRETNSRKGSKPPRLHYAGSTAARRYAIAKRLREAKLFVYTASYWHQPAGLSHNERFSVYTELLKLVIGKIFEKHRALVVTIGKQGGWQHYERELLSELRKIPLEVSLNTGYCTGSFDLASAAKPGVQLADYYVGVVRDHHRGYSNLHELVAHQLMCYERFCLPDL